MVACRLSVLPRHLRHRQKGLGVLPCALELGDVVVDAEEAGSRSVHRERSEHELDVHRCSVFPPAPGDTLRAAVCECLPRDLASVVAARVAEHQVVDRASDRVFGRIAEEIGGCRVPLGYPLIVVHHDHGDRAELDERLEVLALQLDFGKQSCVLDRDADVGRDRREQA